MKVKAIIVVVLWGAAEFATVARAHEIERPAVAVCVDGKLDQYDKSVADHAQTRASTIFRRIGVQVDFHRANSGFCGQSGRSVIRVAYSVHTPAEIAPSELAYALPYEGVHIEVFCDRVPGGDDPRRAEVLAYVLTHEIAHILQGVARHSDSGIMKAHWDKADLIRMRLVPLSFTEGDVDLIHKGLQARAGHNAPGTFLAVASSGQLLDRIK